MMVSKQPPHPPTPTHTYTHFSQQVHIQASPLAFWLRERESPTGTAVAEVDSGPQRRSQGWFPPSVGDGDPGCQAWNSFSCILSSLDFGRVKKPKYHLEYYFQEGIIHSEISNNKFTRTWEREDDFVTYITTLCLYYTMKHY